MKHIYRLLALPLVAVTLTGCIDEVTPTSGVTQGQLEANPSSDALVNAITKHMNTVVNTNTYSDAGYPTLMIRRDVCTADMPVADPAYYYFYNYAYCHSIGHVQTTTDQWNFYNELVHVCNIALRAINRDDPDEYINLATAYMYRAYAEMDMARMYEFFPTNTSLDANYDDIRGLTVPIVNENTTEQQSFHNPRAPFYKMYRYILNDLDTAIGMCWSGYLSTHAAMLDSMGFRKLISKAILAHTIGGACAGIVAHWAWVLIATLIPSVETPEGTYHQVVEYQVYDFNYETNVINVESMWSLTDDDAESWNVDITNDGSVYTIKNLIAHDDVFTATYDEATGTLSIAGGTEFSNIRSYSICGGFGQYTDTKSIIAYINEHQGYIPAKTELAPVIMKVDGNTIKVLTPIFIYNNTLTTGLDTIGQAYQIIDNLQLKK